MLSALTNLESWRQTHFNTPANTGDSAVSADPDFNGLKNLIEFATGTLPNYSNSSNGPPGSLVKNGNTLEFTYTRNHNAVADGFTFLVEWSDTLGNDWSVDQVTHSVMPATNNGISELWKASLPAGTAPKRFVRMKSEKP